MLRLVKFLFLLAMAALGAGFASINPETATIHYYFADLTLPMGMLMLGVLGLGILLGACPRIGSVAREAHFESDFSLI